MTVFVTLSYKLLQLVTPCYKFWKGKGIFNFVSNTWCQSIKSCYKKPVLATLCYKLLQLVTRCYKFWTGKGISFSLL